MRHPKELEASTRLALESGRHPQRYFTVMLGRFWNATWNFSFMTWPAPAAIAAFAADWSSLTVASGAPQDLQVTMDELFGSLGVTKELLLHFAQVRMVGGSFRFLDFQPKSDNRAYCAESPMRLRLLILAGENNPQCGEQHNNRNRCLHQLSRIVLLSCSRR
jgi:hypothetical protein